MENRKANLVIIDTGRQFLGQIEETVFRVYADQNYVQLITDPGYVNAYFSEPQTIDLLIASESDYGAFMQEHEIRHTVLVKAGETGDGLEEETPEDGIVRIPADHLEELTEMMEAFLSEDEPESSADSAASGEMHETKLIGVYSPIGGSGKSLVSVALARKFRKLDQKVLLIGCDAMQSLSVYFSNTRYAGEDLAEKLKNPDDDTYWTILQNIGQEDVSYMLPFKRSFASVGIGGEEIKVLVNTLVSKQDFDVIILDLGSVLTPGLSEYLNDLDAMVLITESNEIANRKIQMLLRDPELLPKCTCIIVANEYRSDGMHISRDSVFGTISPYATWQEALEDPVFYRIALKITE